MTIDVQTFGCRLNTYESEVIRSHAQKAGLEQVIVFNTCAVTAEAERQARQAIRKARKKNPNAKIIVTGCSAQIKPDEYAKMPEVDKVIGNQEKMLAESYDGMFQIKHTNAAETEMFHVKHSERNISNFSQVIADEEKVQVNDIMSVKETASHLVSGFEGKARAFVQVQNGCNHRCTFCIIPYGRGNSRSVPMGEIVEQVRLLVREGYKEIAMTGVDITDYGKDLPGQPTLGQMCRRLLALVPELPRLRLSSLDPVEMDEDLWQLIANEPRLTPHLHISLQAGDDMVLKRMKRRHLRHHVVEFCARARALRPEIVFGADIIAGFPTETDEMFENTLRLVSEVDIIYTHIFPYSARTGTPAAKMPQVPLAVRKARAAKLREAGAKQLSAYLQTRIGQVEEVLVEQAGIGRTSAYASVKFDAKEIPAGTMIHTKIIGAEGENLLGEVVAC